MYCGKFTIASEDVEGLYNLKELVFEVDCPMGELAHSGASISTKHLVLALQAPCTNTTSTLYWCYKRLVLTLQSTLYWHYKVLVAAAQKTFRNTASACCAQIRDKYMRALQPLRWRL